MIRTTRIALPLTKWDRVKPVHFCGAPYHNMFVEAYNESERSMLTGFEP